jgi:conserved oligomeric Golgi complex subunit 8
MYYGMSLGRVGVDFREVLVDPFTDAVDRIVKKYIDEGLHTFQQYTTSSSASISTLYVKTNLSLYPSTSSTSGKAGEGIAGPRTSNQLVVPAPSVLLSYPPLAQLLNSYFAAFNQLRVLAPLSLRESLGIYLKSSLRRASDALALLAPRMREDLNGSEEEEKGGGVSSAFGEACKVYVDTLVPAVVDGFEVHVYGGVSDGSVSGLDRFKDITEPVLVYIPPK